MLFKDSAAQEKMKYIFPSPYEVIRGVRVYPYDVTATGVHSSTYDFKLGYLNVTTEMAGFGQVQALREFGAVLDLGQIAVTHHYMSSVSFLDYAPYTKMQLWLPYIGFIDIDPQAVMDHYIHVYYVIDYHTGKCTAYTVRQRVNVPNTDDHIINISEGIIGLELPIMTDNAVALANQQKIIEANADAESRSTAVASGVSMVASMLAMVGAAVLAPSVAAGVIGIAGGAASAMGAGIKGVTSISRIEDAAANSVAGLEQHFGGSGTSSGAAMWYAPQTVQLHIGRLHAYYPEHYDELYGKPLMQTRDLSAVHGYTEVGRIHLKGFEGATASELAEIESLLQSGVHFPPAP